MEVPSISPFLVDFTV